MDILRGRPVITGEDYPLTVYKAIHNSVGYLDEVNAPPHLQHGARNAYETLRDDFSIMDDKVYRPDGTSTLWDMSNDNLELALVAYGCELLDKQPKDVIPEVVAIDSLLREIDHLKA
ncbi:MAG TPA: hypothetical protein VHT70_00780 [Candidatus Saccharimonadales bacterium]|jgi:hypothetical protein|nr:hypothetical protein [Candidatus Saccharimonadales bacterium]